MAEAIQDIRQLFGLSPSSQILSNYISSLSTTKPPDPEVKSYSDAVYFNYYSLGLSLLFTPTSTYKPTTGLTRDQLEASKLSLDGIDLYNIPKPKLSAETNKTSSRSAELAFSTFPAMPISLTLNPDITNKDGTPLSRPVQLDVTFTTSGKDFVAAFGEPDRKGGGAGPSSGSIGIWCEWSRDGIMVEFGGDEAKGPQAWERGKDAIWKVITMFPVRAT